MIYPHRHLNCFVQSSGYQMNRNSTYMSNSNKETFGRCRLTLDEFHDALNAMPIVTNENQDILLANDAVTNIVCFLQKKTWTRYVLYFLRRNVLQLSEALFTTHEYHQNIYISLLLLFYWVNQTPLIIKHFAILLTNVKNLV